MLEASAQVPANPVALEIELVAPPEPAALATARVLQFSKVTRQLWDASNFSWGQCRAEVIQLGLDGAFKDAVEAGGDDMPALLREVLDPEQPALKQLQTLGLRENRLESIPAAICNLTALTRLRLQQNRLTRVPAVIGNLSYLSELSLQQNLLTRLPESIGNLTALTELYLQDNQLASIPESIGNLTGLTQLRLEQNRLASVPASIGKLTALTGLALHENQLMSIPESIGNLTALLQLMMHNNQFTSVPDGLGGITGLERVCVDDHVIDDRAHTPIFSALRKAGTKTISNPTGRSSLETRLLKERAVKLRVCDGLDCHIQGAKLICTRCQKVAYCSQECQKKHWKNGHKTGCVVPALKAAPVVPSQRKGKKKR